MSSIRNIKHMVGQLFIVGLDGYSVSPTFKSFAQEYSLGGVIYFKRNVQSAGQLAELSNELQFSARVKEQPPFFITIDHEGGKVNRLVKPFTKFPGNENIGDLGSPKIAFEFGVVLAKELRAIGVNVNYAPVIDVLTNPENPVMKGRCFSKDAEVCARMGSAVCRGMQKIGVMAVAKHFPGHGDTKEDSHFTLPKVDKSLEELEKVEFVPFRRAIKSRVDGIMTAHVLNPQLDADYPATLSEKTINGLLRGDLRYNRVVFADDMEMKAITDHYGKADAAVLAINAGCDCLIYRAESGPPVEVLEAVLKAVESKKIAVETLQKAVQRIQAAKQTYASNLKPLEITEVGKFVGLPEHFRLADIITKRELPPDMAE